MILTPVEVILITCGEGSSYCPFKCTDRPRFPHMLSDVYDQCVK